MGDLSWVAGVLLALATLLPAIAKFLMDISALRKKDAQQQVEIDTLWAGLVRRGFLGAKRAGLIKDQAGTYVMRPEVRELFGAKRAALREMKQKLTTFLGREPLDLELAFEIERSHQTWLVETICPAIEQEKFECVALASLIAREENSKDHASGSWLTMGKS